MAKNHISGVQNGSQSVYMGVLGGYLCWNVVFGHFPIEFPIEAEFFVGGLPIELERKQKLFWNPDGKRNGIR